MGERQTEDLKVSGSIPGLGAEHLRYAQAFPSESSGGLVRGSRCVLLD